MGTETANGVLFSYGCCTKFPHTLWLQTTPIYSLTEVQSPDHSVL